jgi:hypothetical protein
MSKIPHFLDNRLTDGGEVVSIMLRPHFKPQKDFLVLISVRGLETPRVIVRLEGLGKLKTFNDLVENRTQLIFFQTVKFYLLNRPSFLKSPMNPQWT